MEKRTMRDYVYLTPSVLRQQLAGRWEEPLAAAFAARPVRILRLVASGSSYNAALCVRPYLRKWLDCEVLVTEPFTFGAYESRLPADELAVVISQSGYSTNALHALDTIRSSVAILQQIPLYVEEAALSLGSSKPKAFFTVTLPMMSSGVLSGAILSWVTLISELSTAILLYTGKTQTLTVAIYTQIVRGNYGIASAMATVLTVMTLLSLIVFNKISKDGDLTL